MADRQSIINDIRKTYGTMLNIQQATAALGFKDRRAAKKFLGERLSRRSS